MTVVLYWEILLPWGTLINVWGHFWSSQLIGGSATGIQWIEARDASKYPTMAMIAIFQPPQQQKNHLAQNFNSARLRNPGLDRPFSSVSSKAYSCEAPAIVEDITGILGGTGGGMRGLHSSNANYLNLNIKHPYS